VTGIVTDVDAVAAALRRHGALACFDYAAAGPYLPIDMTGKDAVFLSPHKFAGGPGSPGVLVAKRALFGSGPPTVPSGGTILFVSPTEQSYHPDPSVREEGGTPAIVESIRAGMVFELKEEAGAAEIARRGRGLARRALASWGANPNIEILGDPHADRLAILTLGLRHPPGLLHGNFVVAVLSDLFGIQARSGCFCAGLYLHRMYPIDDPWSAAMHEEVARGHLGAKLAFTRISFGYFASEAAIGYIVDAVHLVADEGWKLLPYYRFDPASGLWEHEQGGARFSGATAPETVLAVQLEDARGILAGLDPAPPVDPPVTEEFERVRWFPLPSGEAALPSLPPR
jgi:selenocysteine lyase/cysteine desulfurase